MMRPEWLRWMYRGRRPNRLARLMNRSGALLARTGMNRMRTLEVRHARTGRPLTLPVVPVPMDGTTYLVSMLGERANWVRHVRAADGRADVAHPVRALAGHGHQGGGAVHGHRDHGQRHRPSGAGVPHLEGPHAVHAGACQRGAAAVHDPREAIGAPSPVHPPERFAPEHPGLLGAATVRIRP